MADIDLHGMDTKELLVITLKVNINTLKGTNERTGGT